MAQRSTQSRNDDFSSVLTEMRPKTTCEESSPFFSQALDSMPNSFDGFFGKENTYEQSSPSRQTKSSKIEELEKQIELLKRQLTIEKSSMQDELNSMSIEQRPKDDRSLTVTITDFTPEWDYLEGGSKVIICFNLTKEIKSSTKVRISFGDNLVEGSWIQGNVIKCYGRFTFTSTSCFL